MVELSHLLAGSNAPIAVVDREGVCFIIINRPSARNALTRAMRADFASILACADADSKIESIVVTGAGRCFSAGVDLKDRIAGAAPIEPNPAVALRSLSKPAIAAIDGACVTGALEMALSCEFAIATPSARFADTHCKIGLFPRWGGGTLLVSAIGMRRARQMMLTGEFVDAELALTWGLINEIVPQDKLLERAATLAQSIARQARENPLPYRLQIEMLRQIDAATNAHGIEREMLKRFDRERELVTLEGR